MTWDKAKDAIVVGVGVLLIWLLSMLIKGQNDTTATVMEIKKDIAVFSAQVQRQANDIEDLKTADLMLSAEINSLRKGGH